MIVNTSVNSWIGFHVVLIIDMNSTSELTLESISDFGVLSWLVWISLGKRLASSLGLNSDIMIINTGVNSWVSLHVILVIDMDSSSELALESISDFGILSWLVWISLSH